MTGTESSPIGVALLNMGGPADLDSIEPFLQNLLSDPAMLGLPSLLRGPLSRRIARKRAPKVAERYRLIGGASPVLPHSVQQCARLAERLGPGFVVEPVMRYAPPRAAQVLARWSERGIAQVVALSAYPQFSHTTTGSSLGELREQAGRLGMQVIETQAYFDRELFVDSIWAELQKHLEPGCHVLMTAHGLPQKYVDAGDPYRDQVERTAELLAARLPQDTAWSLAYQSRFGPLRWLQPYLDEAIAALAGQGMGKLVLAPLSFSTENLETMYDLDIVATEQARGLGMARVSRVASMGGQDAYIQVLAQQVREALS